jgi:uncharacterized protein
MNADPAAVMRGTRRIAIVGASPNPARPVFDVMGYLIDAGYEVVPVRPGGGSILGLPTVASLEDVDGPVDLVNVFRVGLAAPGIARAAVAIGAKTLWLQPGCISDEAGEIATAGGLTFIQRECTMAVHRRMVVPRP